MNTSNVVATTMPKNGAEARNMAMAHLWQVVPQARKTAPESQLEQQQTKQNNSLRSWSRRHVSEADLVRAIALSKRSANELSKIMVTDLSHHAGLLNLGMIHRMGNPVELQAARARILAALPLKLYKA